MKKVFTAALIGALAVGVSAVPAQANTVEDGGTTCVIRMHDDSLAGFAYSVSAVHADHMNDARVQFMSQAQAREVAKYLNNDWKRRWDEESEEWKNSEEGRQQLEEEEKNFEKYRPLLQECIDGKAKNDGQATPKAGSSGTMTTAETMAIVVSVLALLTSIAGVAAPNVLPLLK